MLVSQAWGLSPCAHHEGVHGNNVQNKQYQILMVSSPSQQALIAQFSPVHIALDD